MLRLWQKLKFSLPNSLLLQQFKLPGEARRAERKFRKSGSTSDKQAFKDAYKKLVQTVKVDQNNFFRKKFGNARGNSKATYKIVNQLLHKDQIKTLPETNYNISLANQFANFFSSKITKIINDLERDTQEIMTQFVPSSSIVQNSAQSFSAFEPITKEYLIELLQKNQ